jgi:cysteine synthase A
LKSKNPSIKIVGVEPRKSPFITEGRSGAHGLQGIGAGFLPKNLDLSVVDRVITVTEEEAYGAARLAAKRSGLLVGISSGAALYAAMKLSLEPENRKKRIVVLLPDAGDRYLSTPLFE